MECSRAGNERRQVVRVLVGFVWAVMVLAAVLLAPCQALVMGFQFFPTCISPGLFTRSFASKVDPQNKRVGVRWKTGRFSRELYHSSSSEGHNDDSGTEDVSGGDKSNFNAQSVCVIDGGDFSELSRELASNLSLPLYPEDSLLLDSLDSVRHYLTIVPYQFHTISSHAIAIERLPVMGQEKSSRKRRSGRKITGRPLFIDFCPPADSRHGKRSRGQAGKDLLLKAVSPFNKGQGVTVFDLTAGFGQDAILIATGGASSVHMVERNPIVAVLLQDALRRLADLADAGEATAKDLHSKLSMQVGDGIEVAGKLLRESPSDAALPDVCYLDPMFPPRSKSAAVKKNMQILHGLLDSQSVSQFYDYGDGDDGSIVDSGGTSAEVELLEEACRVAKLRVVVKRPVNAAPLGGLNHDRRPSYDIRGSANRWDVYVKQ